MPQVYNKRSKHIPIPKDAVYVGRPTIWGNPFTVGVHGEQKQCVELFKVYIRTRKDLLEQLPKLKGKDLVCWCAPKACHADVLLRLANA